VLALSSKNTGVDLAHSQEFETFKELIAQSKRILISTHQLPDGDGLGAEAALFHYLKKARKAVRVYNPDVLPKRYRFLDPKGQILLGPGEVELWDTCDLWIIVDTNDPRRLGKVWSEMAMRSRKIVFLDHHPDLVQGGQNPITYPPNAMVVSDVQSSSIGEMLYRVFRELNLSKLNTDVATGLYVSVMTDTNSFRYARTTRLAHEIAGEMIELGVNPEDIYQSIYSSKELSHLHLLGQLLMNVKTSQQGKLAWMEMPLEIRRKHQASADDTQSFLNLLLLLKDAEVVALFRAEDDGLTRTSIKSKGKVPVHKVAMELGGGGHEFASGLAQDLPLEKASELVIRKLESAITNFERFGK
jgi:phosphoesterase RecJ-like protein